MVLWRWTAWVGMLLLQIGQLVLHPLVRMGTDKRNTKFKILLILVKVQRFASNLIHMPNADVISAQMRNVF